MLPIRTCLVMLALAGVAAAQTIKTPGDSRLVAQHSSQTDDGKEYLDHPNWLGPLYPHSRPGRERRLRACEGRRERSGL